MGVEAPEPRTLYRQEALDRLAAPTTRLERVRPVRPLDAIALAALASLVLVALAWSVLGKVRVTVDGTGILLFPPELTAAGAPAGLLSRSAQPVLAQQRDQLTERLRAATRREEARAAVLARELEVERASLERQLAEAADRIATLEALAGTQREAAARTGRDRRRELLAREELALRVVERARRDLEGAEALAAQGALSAVEVSLAGAAALEAQGELDAVRRDLSDLALEEVDHARQHDALLRDLAEARARRDELEARRLALDRADIERQADAEATLASLRDQRDAVQLALDLRRAPSDEAPGPALPADELLAVVFMDAGHAKRVSPGMEIRVSPDPIERERYGSAVGRVVEVSTWPVGPEQAEALLGSATLAESLTGAGRAVLVLAALERADTPSGYRWTTSSGPPSALTAGTPLTAAVTVERRRPITWLLPALRRLTGAGT